MTPYSNQALSTLIVMLNSLPEGSIVLEFILSSLNQSFEATSSIVDGKRIPSIQYSLPYVTAVPGQIISNLSTGVYLFHHVESGQQYIGSSCNMAIRLSGHLSQFSGAIAPSKLHNFVMANGGLNSVLWSPLYTTFDFTSQFFHLHPDT